MFGSFGAGFDDPTDSEFADLFGGYIEENTNVPSRPLDLGDDGINIRTEADALDSGRPSLTRSWMRFRRCKRTRTSRSRT